MNRTTIFGRRVMIALFAAQLLSVTALTTVSADSAQQVGEIRKLLEQNHLSGPTDNELTQNSVQGMVDSLHDPYTQYFTEDEWKTFSNALEQTFVGIGIVMTEDGDNIYIQDVIPGSPALQAGLLPGDMIVNVQGEKAKGKTLAWIQQKMLGKENTTANMGITRDGRPLQFKLTRKILSLPVATGQMLGA
jgi:carboxyl-terminal processing protease